MARRLPPVNECLNCQAPLSTAFCPHCGQEAVQHTASVRELLADLVDGLFNLDSRFFRTLRLLLFKPGALTLAYNRGQRVRFLPPLRLYLVCSILFFVLLAWTQSRSTATKRPVPIKIEPQRNSPVALTVGPAAAAAPSAAAADRRGAYPKEDHNSKADSPIKHPLVNAGSIQANSLEGLPDTVEGYQKFLTPGQKMSPASVYIIKQVIKLRSLGEAGIIARFMANVPNMMFLLMPLFALALKLLYIRSKTLYVEHLVFLLHAHAFVYIVLSALILLPGSLFTEWAPLIVPVYIFLAMRTVYGQSRWKTGIKLVMLATSYSAILAVCLVGTFVLTFLTI